MMAAMTAIRPACFSGAEDDAALVRTLMREYAAFLNDSVGGEHICVDSLEAELAALPGDYAEPEGTVLLAFDGSDSAGCVALKPLHGDQMHPDERACEMKRLWVRASFHGRHIGRRLAEAVIQAGKERGYSAMYLDTMPRSMPVAYSLYRAMDFLPVQRYNRNPALRQAESLEIAWLRREL
jgi:putative acetyltransferase